VAEKRGTPQGIYRAYDFYFIDGVPPGEGLQCPIAEMTGTNPVSGF